MFADAYRVRREPITIWRVPVGRTANRGAKGLAMQHGHDQQDNSKKDAAEVHAWTQALRKAGFFVSAPAVSLALLPVTRYLSGVRQSNKPPSPQRPSAATARDAPLPCGCAEERRAAGEKKRACLSPEGASLRASPAGRAPQVAPERSAGDADTGVAFLLPTFLWRSKEK